MGNIEQFNFIETKTHGSAETINMPRREFIKTLGTGTGSLLAFGGWLIQDADAQDNVTYSLIVVDFNKCTGCRTCEAVCSQENNKVTVDGEELSGLGNPHLSNVRVHYFNPPVDIPNRCVMCNDAPCVEACPVAPAPDTGNKALYRDEKTMSVKCDPDRCTGCGSCARVCTEKRTGAIVLNPETNMPEGICNLCEGDPACVKYCPFGALTHVKDGMDGREYARSPEKVAGELMTLWYFHKR
jgi:Fe-S-cluster-containing hydrogenase component 2